MRISWLCDLLTCEKWLFSLATVQRCITNTVRTNERKFWWILCEFANQWRGITCRDINWVLECRGGRFNFCVFLFFYTFDWFERDFSRSHSPVISFNLGSPYLQASGGDSPKLSGFVAPSHLAPNFGGTFSPLSSAHAFNLAAFRSPGFLGAHGFAAFGANIAYRDHSPNSFDGNTSGNNNNNNNNNGSGNGSTANPLNAFNTNSNSPTNQYSSARSSISPTTRDGYLNSDYYNHNNNTTTSKLTDSHNNSEYLTSDRHHSHSHTPNSNHHHNSHHHNSNNNNIHSIANSNHHHTFDRATSESPELSVNEQRCSPVESLRSYPTSQKSDEGGNGGSGVGYPSPSHPDSVGSRSPENLTASATKKSVGEMLDHHKIPLSFLGQPLAALHSMTEMKAASNHGGGGGGGGGGNGNSANANITGNGIGLQQTQSQIGSHGAANPHGIDTILSRPPPVTSAGLNALTSGESDSQSVRLHTQRRF